MVTHCPDRHRFAQFRLLEQFVPDKPMPTTFRDLKLCNVDNSLSGPQCQLLYWDRITPEARAEAIEKEDCWRAGVRPAGAAWRTRNKQTRQTFLVSIVVLDHVTMKGRKMRYALLWLLGIPIPVLIIIWLLFGR